MEEETKHEAQKLLQEFDAEEGRLDLLAVQVPAGENRKIRDEILMLAGAGNQDIRKVEFLNIDADVIRARVVRAREDPDNPGVSEEIVRIFEDAGWGWG